MIPLPFSWVCFCLVGYRCSGGFLLGLNQFLPILQKSYPHDVSFRPELTFFVCLDWAFCSCDSLSKHTHKKSDGCERETIMKVRDELGG